MESYIIFTPLIGNFNWGTFIVIVSMLPPFYKTKRRLNCLYSSNTVSQEIFGYLEDNSDIGNNMAVVKQEVLNIYARIPCWALVARDLIG